jgi:hypothetical protein
MSRLPALENLRGFLISPERPWPSSYFHVSRIPETSKRSRIATPAKEGPDLVVVA